MRGLCRANAEQDPQHFRTGHSLSQRGVQTRPSLFNEGKVEPCSESDGLEMVGNIEWFDGSRAFQISIRPGNRRPVHDADCLREREVRIEIGVLIVEAIARPEAGVHVELHQIRQPQLRFVRAGRLAARQFPELFQADRGRALRLQICIDKFKMGEFIVSVVVYVLVHVAVENLQRIGIGIVAAYEVGEFRVLCAAEFVVLEPEVGLEDLSSSQEPQYGRVPFRETAAFVVVLCLEFGGQQCTR